MSGAGLDSTGCWRFCGCGVGEELQGRTNRTASGYTNATYLSRCSPPPRHGPCSASGLLFVLLVWRLRKRDPTLRWSAQLTLAQSVHF